MTSVKSELYIPGGKLNTFPISLVDDIRSANNGCGKNQALNCHVLSCCVFLSFPFTLAPSAGRIRLPFLPRFPPAVPCLLLTTSSPLLPPVPLFPLISPLYLSLFLFLSLSDSCLLCFMPEPDYRHVCCNLVLSCRNLPVYLSLPQFGY